LREYLNGCPELRRTASTNARQDAAVGGDAGTADENCIVGSQTFATSTGSPRRLAAERAMHQSRKDLSASNTARLDGVMIAPG
jgi:hypothetical protein